ncbi:hypothetical protein H696_06007 [Fonticula alba]|uniref:Uncharacterized protein n=1 Tax=Fonticula alba TaxID=691883 RepID=A0A058Z1X7_FONAL|nr:hypothetical protein H696_06007 [Fonticula alba]KCV67487.1 hypothetical protein H696_06007 [Fonticula alba]|eukprot:XP_009498048.1 hypothetical protein H696_06007 [Fonticula alba]
MHTPTWLALPADDLAAKLLEHVTRNAADFARLPAAEFVDSELLRHIADAPAHFTLAPFAAVVGGAASQEAIKIISGAEAPFNNFAYFDSGVGGLAGRGLGAAGSPSWQVGGAEVVLAQP